LGYNDLSCYGSKTIKTPHIDQLAKEGRKFTDYMNASSICTPSRSALLTGCYPKRVGMEKKVIFPHHTKGLHPDEQTFAELAKQTDYLTACIGKWHVGHEPELLPTKQGFDYYFGIPYSNDMNQRGSKLKRPGRSLEEQAKEWANPETTLTSWETPLYEGEKVIEMPVDQRTITRRYTDKTIEKIKQAQQKQQPFLIYLAHSMPHLPLYVPQELWQEDFNQSYRITVEHIDNEIGRIVKTLKETKLDQNTYIFFTSDNGPSPKQLGSAHPLKGEKFSNDEGGHRVPFIAWAPNKIPADTTYTGLITSLDIFPTIEKLTGAKRGNQIIDGHDITGLLSKDLPSQTKHFLYFNTPGQLTGIRLGDYKLLLGKGAKKGKEGKKALYNLQQDISEQNNLISQKQEEAANLEKKMQELDAEITKNARPAWQAVEN